MGLSSRARSLNKYLRNVTTDVSVAKWISLEKKMAPESFLKTLRGMFHSHTQHNLSFYNSKSPFII